MNAYWIVVADAGRARLFSREKKFSPLQEVESLVHPEARLRRQDLTSDRSGQVQESRTPGEYPAEESTDPKDLEAQAFAREIAERLHTAHHQGRFEHLVLMADPRFLGELRKHLAGSTADAVAATVSVNLTRGDIDHITRSADSALE